MRCLAALLVLLLSGCAGASHGAPAPLPKDFTITQPAVGGAVVQETYLINVTATARLNATLVWGTVGNRFDLDLTAGGSSATQGAIDGSTARLEWTLYPATYVLKVSGRPAQADVWHLEAHFTRA